MTDCENELNPEMYQGYLKVLARMHLHKKLRRMVDASDVVQETLLEAHRSLDQFQGGADSCKFKSWLKKILIHKLCDLGRYHQRDSRDADRAVSLQAMIEENASRLEMLAANMTSPSGRVVKNEMVIRFADALEQLPVDEKQVLQAMLLEDMTRLETAQFLGKTTGQVAGNYRRGIEKLRSLLQLEN